MQTFGTTAFHDKTGGEKMNQSKFATAGKVHIVSNENGQIVFELDPIPPYRVDQRESGEGHHTLLVRQNLIFGKFLMLPDNSVGIVDSSVQFTFRTTSSVSEGQNVRLIIAGSELVRYMSLPAGSIDTINVERLI